MGEPPIPTPPLAREVKFRNLCSGLLDTAVSMTAETEFRRIELRRNGGLRRAESPPQSGVRFRFAYRGDRVAYVFELLG